MPRLLALAEYLEAPAFLASCVEHAAPSLDRICNMPEWRCKSISPETFQKVLSGVSAKVAVAVSHRRDCAFPKDVTTKDSGLRRKVRLRVYSCFKLRIPGGTTCSETAKCIETA